MTEHNLSVLLGEAPVADRAARIARGRGERAARARYAQRVAARAPARCAAGRAGVRGGHGAHRRDDGVEPADDLDHRVVRQSGAERRRTLFAPSTTVYQLSAGFSFPLSSFSRGRRRNRGRACARRSGEGARTRTRRSARCATRTMRSSACAPSRDQVAAQATQADALRHALELAELRYSSGVASYLDVLDAQRNLFAAELALSQAQLQQLTAAVQLYKALGGSWKF